MATFISIATKLASLARAVKATMHSSGQVPPTQISITLNKPVQFHGNIEVCGAMDHVVAVPRWLALATCFVFAGVVINVLVFLYHLRK